MKGLTSRKHSGIVRALAARYGHFVPGRRFEYGVKILASKQLSKTLNKIFVHTHYAFSKSSYIPILYQNVDKCQHFAPNFGPIVTDRRPTNAMLFSKMPTITSHPHAFIQQYVPYDFPLDNFVCFSASLTLHLWSHLTKYGIKHDKLGTGIPAKSSVCSLLATEQPSNSPRQFPQTHTGDSEKIGTF